MSLVHIRLNQISDSSEVVSYTVESPDFSEEGVIWEEIGILRILKLEKKYEFIYSQIAQDNMLIPPELYSLSEDQRNHELTNKYQNYGFGVWSKCINYWAQALIQQAHYPTHYP